MPSVFEKQMRDNADAMYGQFGVAASYADNAGGGVDGITVIVHRNEPVQVDRQSRAAGETQTGEIRVRAGEVAKPAKGGRFTVDQSASGGAGVEVWTIVNTPVFKNGQHYCTCSRSGAERIMERRARE